MNKSELAINLIRDYLQCHHTLEKADVILVLGSTDTRVAQRAAELYREGYAPLCITTGNSSKVRTNIVTLEKPEADIFAEIMIQNGVPKEKIIIENKSTNTGENISYAYEKIKDKKINSILIVQKPYMERRALATFEKQWPDKNISFLVTSSKCTIDEYCEGFCEKYWLINMMIGDLQRIIEYPSLGFQSYQEVPANVLSAYKFLIEEGFTQQLIKN